MTTKPIGDEQLVLLREELYDGTPPWPQAALIARLDAMKAENTKLRERLKPFAEVADWYGEPMVDSRYIEIELPYGHFRRARDSLRGDPDAE